jgi:hypothetical protein
MRDRSSVRADEIAEVDAYFWTAESPGDRLAGRLTFEPRDGADIEVMGMLPLVDARQPTTVFGEIPGRYVRLERAFVTSTTGRAAGPSQQRLHSNALFVGAELPPHHSLAFRSMRIRLADWDDWIGTPVISSPFLATPQVHVSVESPGVVESAQAPGVSIEVAHRAGASGGTKARKVEVVSTSEISITSDVPRTALTEWMRVARGLRDLLTVAAEEAVAYDELSFEFADDGGTPLEAHLFVPVPNPRPALRFGSADFLFTLDDLGGLAGIGRWLGLWEQRRSVVTLALAARYSDGLSMENFLLNEVTAAEAYDGLTNPARAMPRPAFRELRRQVVAVTPADQRDFVNGLFNHANTPRLRDRLHRLLHRVDPELRPLIPNPDQWTDAAMLARNDIAHGNGIDHDGGALRTLAETAYYLTVANLLLELDQSRGLVQKLSLSRRWHGLSHGLGAAIDSVLAASREDDD